MVENKTELEVLREATEGLGFEDFYNIMVTVKKVTESYNKLNPNAKEDNYAEMWLQIAEQTNRPEQDKEKVTEAFRKLHPDMTDLTFETTKELSKIDS